MADPISVTVIRGATVEAAHRVHAVAVDREGRRVAMAGDADLVTLMRSAAKPLQALPLARARTDLDDRELAIACASHLADEEQLAAVGSLLARADAKEDDLVCGMEGEPPSRLRHNCSGNHAGMLVVARARGWEIQGYERPDHPVQRTLLDAVAAAAEVGPEEVVIAGDGCGVPTFGLPLERMALAFARLEQVEGGARIAEAMQSQPILIRGPESADTRLMQAGHGWVAKGGAEAVFCAASPDGLGVTLKVEDGGSRALAPALAAFLPKLGYDLLWPAAEPLRNSVGRVVGEIAAKSA